MIDDETGSRESMAIALEKAGLRVQTFDDAAKALDLLGRCLRQLVRVVESNVCDFDLLGRRVVSGAVDFDVSSWARHAAWGVRRGAWRVDRRVAPLAFCVPISDCLACRGQSEA